MEWESSAKASCGHAAIDGDLGSGDVAGCIGQEESDGSDDIGRIAQTTQGGSALESGLAGTI